MHISMVRAALALAALAGVAGCGGREAPPASLAEARAALEAARLSNAPAAAPLDMRLAEERLGLAENAYRDEKYRRADEYAQQALIDAQVARAKADAAQAQRATEELEATVRALRESSRPRPLTGSGG